MSEKDPLVPEAVAAGRKRWREASENGFAKVPAWKKDWTTVSGAPVEPLVGPDTISGFDPERDLGWPGEYPFTRGVQATGYRGKLWTMRQFAGYGTAKQTNERFHYLLDHGQTGLSTAFHLPTLYGYDSDHEMARGEVGKCGVAIDSLARHGGPLRRHRPRPRHDVDDDQLDRADRARDVPGRGREARHPLGAGRRHAPERHPEGVHRSEGVHLPAPALDAPGDRPVLLLREARPEVEHDLDLRLPHPGGGLDGAAGARLHAPRRRRVRPVRDRSGAPGRRVRPAPLLLLQLAQRLLRGDRQVPGGPPRVGARR